MNYFITRSNFLRVARKVKYDENEQDISEIYKRELHFLSKFEMNEILCARDFLIKAQDHFYKFRGAGFRPDTYHYVNESSRYAKYHIDEYCPGLNSILHDFEIPTEIRFKQGSAEIDTAKVEEFRNWFKQNDIKELFLNDKEHFLNKMQVKFGISNRPHIPKEFEFSGGGAQGINNLSLEEIENKIDVLLDKDKEYKNSSQEKLKILVEHNFSNKTFLATSKKYADRQIEKNNTGFSDEKVREILKEYYDKIKKPIIDLLIEYWIIKINPNLDFSKNILDQLQFKPCSVCCQDFNENVNGLVDL